MARRLTLRARLALLTAAAVALAVAVCAAAGWYLTRNQLYRELDRRLGASAAGPPGPEGPGGPGGPGGRIQRMMGREIAGALAACRPDA
ncbi:hypothetical protein QP089_48600, partial [Actinomadura sp. OS1-43]|nr:hypothetical protein [Actinomadura sp. OS1-43]